MKVGHSLRSATPLLARSRIRPGVPTITCTASSKRTISSRSSVPPVVTITLIPKCLPRVLQTCDVCIANSRVGTRMRACTLLFFGFTFWRAGITKAAVFPVPFLARARISLPVRATGIASSWIGDGFSNPASKIPINRFRFSLKSSKSRPFVAVTSYPHVQLYVLADSFEKEERTSVCSLVSFVGSLRSFFQSSLLLGH